MASEPLSTMTVEEYLELEESHPDTRYEYLNGHISLMSGGTLNHAAISGNVYTLLKTAVRGGRCRVYNSDVKVRVSETYYFHPDVTLTCDARDQGTNDVILYPRLVVEVLSPSTEARDRGRKLQCYLACPTIEEYLLIDSREYKIELYRKEPPKWVYYAFGIEDEVELTSIKARFFVQDVYEDIVFAAVNHQQNPWPTHDERE